MICYTVLGTVKQGFALGSIIMQQRNLNDAMDDKRQQLLKPKSSTKKHMIRTRLLIFLVLPSLNSN